MRPALIRHATRFSFLSVCVLFLAGCSHQDGSTTADPRLRTVLLDSDGTHSYLAMTVDSMGQLFIGGKENLYVYEPKSGGLFEQRRELWHFPDDTWIFNIAVRGHDLYVLTANRMFYAIAALAYNLIKAVQILYLPEECQSWTVATLLRQVVRLPAVLVQHARRMIARVEVAPSWLNWWQAWESRWRAGSAMPALSTA